METGKGQHVRGFLAKVPVGPGESQTQPQSLDPGSWSLEQILLAPLEHLGLLSPSPQLSLHVHLYLAGRDCSLASPGHARPVRSSVEPR